MYIRKHHFRFYAVVFSFLAFLFLLVLRLFFIQCFRSDYLTELAEKQHNFYTELEPVRGTIFDRDLKSLSYNIAADSLYAVPSEIEDKIYLADELEAILGLEKDFLLNRLRRKKSFIWLARKVSRQQVEDINELDVKGLGFIRESKRCYPNNELASHVLGFVGLDNNGLEGLELKYDKYLKGEPGWCESIKDAKQRPLFMSDKFIPPRDGYDLVLTIDQEIQFIAEYELDKAYRKSKAVGAIIVVMNPQTGAILAMANRPTFDPNDKAVESEARRNRAITDYFEPGSVFKIVTASAALEENAVSEEDKFFCENGKYKVGNHILRDHKPHGWLSFTEVISESSNIGVTKIAQLLGAETVYKYAKLFGFNSFTGIELPGEVKGVLRPPKTWSKTSIGAIPIGQEVCVTAIQLANMISIIANGGVLYKPYIVGKIVDKTGEIINEFAPKKLRRVISQETSRRMKNILAQVVAEGTGRRANLANFRVAGKTGTAQKVENGRYSNSKFIATFLGFAPLDNPRIAVVVIVDEPKGTHYGGTVSAPVFKKVVNKVLKYLQVSRGIEMARER